MSLEGGKKRTWRAVAVWVYDSLSGYLDVRAESSDFVVDGPEWKRCLRIINKIDREREVAEDGGLVDYALLPIRATIRDGMAHMDSPGGLCATCRGDCMQVAEQARLRFGVDDGDPDYYRIDHVEGSPDVRIVILDSTLHARMIRCQSACTALLRNTQKPWAPFDRNIRALVARMLWDTRWDERWDMDDADDDGHEESQKKLKSEGWTPQ